MKPRLHAENLGIRFLFDSESRPVLPGVAGIRRRGAESWGVRELSFTVEGGEGVALIGPSGSGKTTVLRALAGVYEPDEGRLGIDGRVGCLLSIEAGLHRDLTGRENVRLLATLAGIPQTKLDETADRVQERVGIGAAFDRQVSSYSQGMRARLGFAVAEQARPDILLLDEVHEALDHEFRSHVEARAHALIAEGGIVIAAGHDHPLLHRLCDRALLLRDGRLVEIGEFGAVRERYLGREAA